MTAQSPRAERNWFHFKLGLRVKFKKTFIMNKKIVKKQGEIVCVYNSTHVNINGVLKLFLELIEKNQSVLVVTVVIVFFLF